MTNIDLNITRLVSGNVERWKAKAIVATTLKLIFQLCLLSPNHSIRDFYDPTERNRVAPISLIKNDPRQFFSHTCRLVFKIDSLSRGPNQFRQRRNENKCPTLRGPKPEARSEISGQFRIWIARCGFKLGRIYQNPRYSLDFSPGISYCRNWKVEPIKF